MKTCPGCKNKYHDSVWLDKELGICSKCYHRHFHSTYKMWDVKQKKWVLRKGQSKQKSLECFFLKGSGL